MRIAALVASTGLLLSGCGGSDDHPSRELPTIHVSAQWAFADLRRTYVIRTEAEWIDLWIAHSAPSGWPPVPSPVPSIDFSRHMVLGLTHGSAPNQCHSLRIRSVLEHEHEIEVEYLEFTPGPNAICPQAMADLSDFVVVVRSDKPVSFRRGSP